LRIIAIENSINLQGVRSKKEIICILEKHFSLVNNKILPVVSTTFEVLLDSEKRINISLWFTKLGGSKVLKRFLISKDFKRMQLQLSIKEGLSFSDVVNNKKKQVFVHLILALLAASFLSDDLFYKVYNYHLNTKVLEIEKSFQSKINSLENKLLVKEFGCKINRLDWELFNLAYALYVIKIGNIYKIGAVGISVKGVSTDDRLDNQLSSHRNTYAKFELITVISFKDSNSVLLFKQVLKYSLHLYCIGRDTDTHLEQFCFEGTNVDINSVILKLFDDMQVDSQELGSICPSKKIKAYNDCVLNNLV
jgi:hypothetical protein